MLLKTVHAETQSMNNSPAKQSMLIALTAHVCWQEAVATAAGSAHRQYRTTASARMAMLLPPIPRYKLSSGYLHCFVVLARALLSVKVQEVCARSRMTCTVC